MLPCKLIIHHPLNSPIQVAQRSVVYNMETIYVNLVVEAFDYALALMVIVTMVALGYGELVIAARILITLQNLQIVGGVLVFVSDTFMPPV